MKRWLRYHNLLFVLIFTSGALAGQHWKNPALRYQDEHKKYRGAVCPIGADSIQHFVYFSRDRQEIKDHPLLKSSRFAGAQIMYSWKDLEPQKDAYDFSMIRADLKYLSQFGKQLFVQLQDVTFYANNKAVPDYLCTPEYDGGAVLQLNEQGQPEGWVAKRWNPAVNARFALLLKALGEEFDGVIEGVNLQETAIGVNEQTAPDFSETAYVAGLKANMLALRDAFPVSTTMIYANFIPGEWLPWEDKGYLKGIYQYGNEIGVGLGAPDLMVTRRGQLNHPLAMMHESSYTVPLGIAIQDGNYVGKTGADSDYQEGGRADAGRQNKVPMLHAFARDFLRVNYMFWANQAPYFVEDVLPCLDPE